MGLAAPLLAIPILGGATFALWWISRHLAGRSALAAVILVPLLAFGDWWLALSTLTRAQYVCAECGRTEEQWRFAGIVVSRALHDDGAEYTRRYAPKEHAHTWHFESCRWRGTGMVECTEQVIGGWFRVLPKLADREAADALVLQARSLPLEERCRLMDEISSGVWLQEKSLGGIDQAFETWNARRRSR